MRFMFAVFNQAQKLGRKFALSVSAMAAAALLAACEPVPLGGNTGQSINTNKPVPVALLVPRGSAQQGDIALAQSAENAARLAIADLQGVQIDLRIYDTAGDPARATSAAAQAITEGARIILGPVYAEAANAAGLEAAKRNVNVLAFSNNTSIAGGNVFVLGPTFNSAANRVVGYAKRQGKNNLVVVSDNNAAGQLGRAAVQQAALGAGANIVGSISYDLSQQGVINSIPAVSDAVRQNGADGIVLTANSVGALPLLTQLLPEAGVSTETVQYMGLARWDSPAQTLALPGVQGGWFALPDPEVTAQFRNRYQAAYGVAPNPIGALAYDGIAAIGALVATGKPDALTSRALTQPGGFSGASGVFRLRPDGTNERGLAIATIQEQKVIQLDPAPKSFGGAGF